MISKIFRELIAACNACIISCEHCIEKSKQCSQAGSADRVCQDFIRASHDCCNAATTCIKACNAMIEEFSQQGHQEHMEALNACIKQLGEHNRILEASANRCKIDTSCKNAVAEASEACDQTIKALDECIESCEKHEVIYLNIKK